MNNLKGDRAKSAAKHLPNINIWQHEATPLHVLIDCAPFLDFRKDLLVVDAKVNIDIMETG